MQVLALVWCSSCAPLPDWLKPWALAGAIGFFLVVLAWATWTRGRRR